MAQMHSYLVENIKLNLNYIEQNFCQEDFLVIFNKIASSIENGSDLLKKLSEQIEEDMDVKELSELDDLVEKNLTNLEIENIIKLSSN
ncbi:5443_t:CDS:2 [Gigaspora rosea]|nr:5443_t:CDS:2 [Gigaspora rosea]